MPYLKRLSKRPYSKKPLLPPQNSWLQACYDPKHGQAKVKSLATKSCKIFNVFHHFVDPRHCRVYDFQTLFQHFHDGHCLKSVQMRRFSWSVFSYIQTEYVDLLHKSPYLVGIQENTDQKNSIFGHFSYSRWSLLQRNQYIDFLSLST